MGVLATTRKPRREYTVSYLEYKAILGRTANRVKGCRGVREVMTETTTCLHEEVAGRWGCWVWSRNPEQSAEEQREWRSVEGKVLAGLCDRGTEKRQGAGESRSRDRRTAGKSENRYKNVWKRRVQAEWHGRTHALVSDSSPTLFISTAYKDVSLLLPQLP